MENENVIFCSECGQKNSGTSSFCSKCGNKLHKTVLEKSSYTTNNGSASYTTNNDSVRYDDMDDINLFVQKNQMFYQEKFDRIIKTGDKKTWNWAAFFLSIYWMLYRKMYLQAGGLFLLNFLVGCIPYIGWLLNIGIWIGVGMYSNSLYLDHIRKKLAEINMINSNDKEFMIMKKGGTNLVLPIAIAVGGFVIAFILIILFASVMGSMLYYY